MYSFKVIKHYKVLTFVSKIDCTVPNVQLRKRSPVG